MTTLTVSTSSTSTNNETTSPNKKRKRSSIQQEPVDVEKQKQQQNGNGTNERQQQLQLKDNTPYMGASEFSSILNNCTSDNVIEIIRCLQKFVKIVRYERRIAFSIYRNNPSSSTTTGSTTGNKANNGEQLDDIDDDENNSDEDDDDTDTDDEQLLAQDDNNKNTSRTSNDQDNTGMKRKKMKGTTKKNKNNNEEAWKDDTANYNVPFVGTSIRTMNVVSGNSSIGNSNRSNVAKVGVWPTGLVQQYIQKSPLAIELTSTAGSSNVNNNNNNNNANTISVPYGSIQKVLIRKKIIRLATIIDKWYLRVMIELVTASIEPNKLQFVLYGRRKSSSSTTTVRSSSSTTTINDFRFINEIIVNIVPGLLQLIKDNIGKQQSQISNHQKKYGDDRIPLIIRLIHYLTLSSVPGIGRTVIRLFHTILSDDVLRSLLRSSLQQQQPSSSHLSSSSSITTTGTGNTGTTSNRVEDSKRKDTVAATAMMKQYRIIILCRISIIKLVTSLIQFFSNDTIIMSTICRGSTTSSIGSQSNQQVGNNSTNTTTTTSGILYITLRDGIRLSIDSHNEQQQHHTKSLQRTLTQFFKVLREIMFPVSKELVVTVVEDNKRNNNRRSGKNSKVVITSGTKCLLSESIFTREALNSLCSLQKHAPKSISDDNGTDNITYESILMGTDDSMNTGSTIIKETIQVKVAIEARRLLYSLMSDKVRSPLLQSINYWYKQQQQRRQQQTRQLASNSNSSSSMTTLNTNSVCHTQQSIVRCILSLFNDGYSNPQVHRFLLHVLSSTPILVPELFRTVTLPDYTKQSNVIFLYVSYVHFLSSILQNGPTVMQCCNNSSVEEQNNVNSNNTNKKDTSKLQNVDDVVSSILPSIFKKQLYNRLFLPTTNPLVVYETLKLVIVALRRCQQYLPIYGRSNQLLSTKLWNTLLTNLPDLKVLLNYAMKLISQLRKQKSNTIIYGLVCDIITHMVYCFSGSIQSSIQSIDWMKLVPTDVQAFTCLPTMVQRSVLNAVKATVTTQETLQSFQISTFQSVLKVVLKAEKTTSTAPNGAPSAVARSIAQCVLERLWSNVAIDSWELIAVIQFEASCWLESLTIDILDEFCLLLHKSQINKATAVVAVAQSWKGSNLPNPVTSLQFSSLLVHSIQYIQKGIASIAFVRCVCHVTTNLILFMQNPLSLASIICTSLSPKAESTEKISQIVISYCQSLIQHDSHSKENRSRCLQDLLQCVFTNQSPLLVFTIDPTAIHETSSSFLSLSRQLSHICLVSDDKEVQNKYISLIGKLLPATLQSISIHAINAIIPILETIRKTYASQCQVIDLILATWKVTPCRSNDLVKDANTMRQKKLDSSALFTSYVVNDKSGIASSAVVLKNLMSNKSNDVSIVDKYSNASITNFLRLFMKNIATEGAYTIVSYEVMKSLCKMIYSSTNVEASSDNELLVLAWQATVAFLSNNHRSLLLSGPVDVNRTVERVILLQHLFDKANIDESISHNSLLVEIVQSDKARYSKPVINLITDTNYENILDNVELQNALFHAVTYDDIADTDCYKIEQLFQSVLHRLEFGLGGDMKDARYLESLTYLICALCTKERLPPSFQSSNFSVVVKELLKEDVQTRIRSTSKCTQYNIFLLIFRYIQLPLTEKQDGCRITAMLILRLSRHISQTLKATNKTLRTSLSDEEVGPLGLLHLLVKSLDQSHMIDHAYLSSCESTWIGDIIRPCLKYGIGNVKGYTQNDQIICIRTVRRLLVMMSNSASMYGINTTTECCMVAKQVFEMTTTHSKIIDVLLEIAGDSSLIKLEIIKLLLTCTKLWDSSSPFDEEIWRMLLSAYHASMSEPDEMLREILFSYGKLAHEDSNVHFLDQWKWGSNRFQTDLDNEWDWLAECLQLNRINMTIRRFPTKNRTFGLKFGSDDTLNFEKDKRYSPLFLLPIILGALEDDFTNNIRERYCPTSYNTEETGNDANQYHSIQSVENGSNSIVSNDSVAGLCFIQRLCDKGIVAFALACLCSESSVIRGMAFAILGRILTAIDTVEAHRMGTWRNRPQLEMILKSCIRSIVLHHSSSSSSLSMSFTKKQSESMDEDDDNDGKRQSSSDSIVPKISSFAAIFLAKASFIVSYPSDPLYGVIHKYFLRTETDNGAFLDLHKIPSFMYMFCSSNGTDTIQQIHSERRFAIELIRDGCIDHYNDDDDESDENEYNGYRLLQLSYIPDLLLTSIENTIVGTMQDNDKETVLVLQALCRMCQTGGSRAVQHLICRMGLVGWIRTFLIDHNFLSLFSTSTSRLAFFELVQSTIKLAKIALHDKLISVTDILLSITGIPYKICEIVIQTVAAEKIDSIKYLMSTTAIDILYSLVTIHSDYDDNVDDDIISSSATLSSQFDCVNSINIATMIQFLSCLPNKNEFDDDDNSSNVGNDSNHNFWTTERTVKILQAVCSLTINNQSIINNDEEENMLLIGKFVLYILQNVIHLEQKQTQDDIYSHITMDTKSVFYSSSDEMTTTGTTNNTTTITKKSLRCLVLKQIKVLLLQYDDDNSCTKMTTTTQTTTTKASILPVIRTILDKLLVWRRYCSMNKSSRTLWYDCTSILIECTTNADTDTSNNNYIDSDDDSILYLAKEVLQYR